MNKLLEGNGVMIYFLLFLFMYLILFTKGELVTTEKIFAAYEHEKKIEKYGQNYADEFASDLEELDFLEEEELTSIDYLFYALLAFLETVKLPYITFFLFLGFELISPLDGNRFKPIFKAVMIAELVFVLQDIMQQSYLFFFRPDRTMQDIAYSKPLALKSLLGPGVSLDGYVRYVIGYADFFELFYVLVLAWALSILYQTSFKQLLPKVGLYYFISQLLLVVFLMFLFEIII
jgi:hypothetical protein|uniref:hypothetical protein n=1 Tax=Bacteroidota TaxID=976 RepID=UPI004047579B